MKHIALLVTIALFNQASAWTATPFEITSADPSWQWQNGILLHEGLPFSGSTKQAETNGFVISRYSAGKLNGEQRRHFHGGQLQSVRYFENGLKVGTHRGWWQNGIPQFEYHFVADLHHGVAYNWHRNGQLASQFHYQKGLESGIQQLWFDDGRLRAQYQMIAGRRYGWMGSKLCN